MTLDKLLGGNADYLESLTDKELNEFFLPYLTVTRPSPEQAKKMEKVGEVKQVNKTKQREKQAAFDKLNDLFFQKTGKRLTE